MLGGKKELGQRGREKERERGDGKGRGERRTEEKGGHFPGETGREREAKQDAPLPFFQQNWFRQIPELISTKFFKLLVFR